MQGSEKNQLAEYMSGSIRNIMTKANKNVLSNPREAKFAYKMQRLFEKSEKLRSKMAETEELDVPPFLISSISTTCNLHCKGCYARSNGIAEDAEADRKQTFTPQQWRDIFTEAASMGINFSLLAGGEPMMRRDILEQVAEVKDMIFPIFTNGTLIGPTYMEFLRKHLNMVPIISIEGTAMGTDERRGRGVFNRAMQSSLSMCLPRLVWSIWRSTMSMWRRWNPSWKSVAPTILSSLTSHPFFSKHF